MVHSGFVKLKYKIMENLFCGIDISKDYLDIALCQGSEKEIVFDSKVANSEKGINKLIKELDVQAKGKKFWVCFEHTGNYGLLLAYLLHKAKITFSLVSSLEIMRSSGLIRGKSDPVDAKRIALYAATFSHKLKPYQLPDKAILKLKSLLTIREQYVRIRTQFKNAIKSLKISAECIDLKQEIQTFQKEIKRYNKLVEAVELKMETIIEQEEQLNQNYKKSIQIIGVGPITATAILVYTNNFTSFDNPRKFNCYCGLAPFEYSSGQSIKRPTKTSRYRNKDMKKLLFNAANTAIIYDQQIRTYFKRKTADGKHKMSVINAIACKIVLRVFAVVKRDEPFVRFSV